MLDILDTLIVREYVASLPPRERQLAELLMSGHTQTSAAKQLGLSVRMVRYHVQRVRQNFSNDTPERNKRRAISLARVRNRII